MSSTRQLGIFAKYWEPGRVKTRLAATVGEHLAAEFHLTCLATLLTQFGDFPVHRVLAYAPRQREAEFVSLAGDRWRLEPQADGDLGQRMAAYFRSAFDAGMTRVILIGSDSPQLRKASVQSAMAALDEASVVLGPCDDGGYYLIGGRPEMPDVFQEVDWSTSRVWDQTVAQLQAQGTRWGALEPSFDVDTVDDLVSLVPQLPPHESYQDLRQIAERCVRAHAD